jgi:hypothetical protein
MIGGHLPCSRVQLLNVNVPVAHITRLRSVLPLAISGAPLVRADLKAKHGLCGAHLLSRVLPSLAPQPIHLRPQPIHLGHNRSLAAINSRTNTTKAPRSNDSRPLITAPSDTPAAYQP